MGAFEDFMKSAKEDSSLAKPLEAVAEDTSLNLESADTLLNQVADFLENPTRDEQAQLRNDLQNKIGTLLTIQNDRIISDPEANKSLSSKIAQLNVALEQVRNAIQ